MLHSRLIIGSDTNDDRRITLDSLGAKITVPVSLYDSSGTQISAFGEGHTTAGDGTATVTTAGTRVQMSSQACKRVIITAHESNTGTLVVGGATVVAALAGRRGVGLYPTQSQIFNVSNINLLYIDSTANSDIAHFYYEN